MNRILRATDAGWEVEADPRNAELVIEQLGLTSENVSGTDEDDLTDDTSLLGFDITTFRGIAVRCNYGPGQARCAFHHQRALPRNVSSDDWVALEVEEVWP